MYRGARPSQVPQGPIQLMPASFDHWPPAYCHDRHRDGVSTAVETMLCMSPDQRLIHQGWYASAPTCQTYSSRNNAELSVGRIPPWSHLVNTGLTGPFYSERTSGSFSIDTHCGCGFASPNHRALASTTTWWIMEHAILSWKGPYSIMWVMELTLHKTQYTSHKRCWERGSMTLEATRSFWLDGRLSCSAEVQLNTTAWRQCLSSLGCPPPGPSSLCFESRTVIWLCAPNRKLMCSGKLGVYPGLPATPRGYLCSHPCNHGLFRLDGPRNMRNI